jgi:uncharacterized protein (DUF58 family)
MNPPILPLLMVTLLITFLLVLLRLGNYQSATWAISRYVWFYKLTENGRYLIYIGCIAMAFGGASLGVPVYILLCIFFVLGASAWLVNLVHSPRLAIVGTPPATGTAGHALVIDVLVRNRGSRTAYDVDTEYPILPSGLHEQGGSAPCPRLPAGASFRSQRLVLPERRGVYRLPRLRAFSTFPFRIMRSARGGTLPANSLVVVPNFHSLDEVQLPIGRRYQPGGVSLTSEIGESPEYLGNREFRPGDRVKHIEHRAWARTGKLAVREYREEFYTRVAIILDTQIEQRLIGRRKALRRLEAGISLTAAVSEALARGESLVDLFAAGPDLHIFRAGRHTAHLENILEILAGVSPCRNEPFIDITSELSEEIARTSSVVCVFLQWNEARRELVELATASGCAVKVLLVGDHDLSSIPEEFFPRAIAVEDIEQGRFSTV